MNNSRLISYSPSIVVAVSALRFAEGAANNAEVIRSFSGFGEGLLKVPSFPEKHVGRSTHVVPVLYSFVGLFPLEVRCSRNDSSLIHIHSLFKTHATLPCPGTNEGRHVEGLLFAQVPAN